MKYKKKVKKKLFKFLVKYRKELKIFLEGTNPRYWNKTNL